MYYQTVGINAWKWSIIQGAGQAKSAVAGVSNVLNLGSGMINKPLKRGPGMQIFDKQHDSLPTLRGSLRAVWA